MANPEQGPQKLSAAERALRPNGTEVLVAEGKTPDIYNLGYDVGKNNIYYGVRIPPIPWKDSETRWQGFGGVEFYTSQGEYVGQGQESVISGQQAKEITERIVSTEAKIALGERINAISAENKANPPELFG